MSIKVLKILDICLRMFSESLNKKKYISRQSWLSYYQPIPEYLFCITGIFKLLLHALKYVLKLYTGYVPLVCAPTNIMPYTQILI